MNRVSLALAAIAAGVALLALGLDALMNKLDAARTAAGAVDDPGEPVAGNFERG
ncbi:hypothetical protein [Kutzneria chonburiensis]|uniref:Uncharacterized protein n=1 Tax=Kutzneria chonburiensis TaxID=1483604 RepID=A0ABV6N4F3_9PSEU|nr:hypothetical protein [Kutzneria chonburiensis]